MHCSQLLLVPVITDGRVRVLFLGATHVGCLCFVCASMVLSVMALQATSSELRAGAVGYLSPAAF